MNSALPLSPDSPTVFVVDDDQQVRRALDRLLRSAGLAVRVFDSAPAFLEQAADQPGCLILDMKMPKVSGLDLQAILADRGLHMPIIFLTGHNDVPATVRAMKGGATDFLTKPFRAKDLLAAVHAALQKDGAQRKLQAERADIHDRAARLTARELQVCQRVVTGAPNKVIATELGIAERTVKVHRARVMQKMQVVSVAELTRLAERGALEFRKERVKPPVLP